MKKAIVRRHFLRGLGVSLALPMFDSMCCDASTVASSKAQRFVCVSPTYGMNPEGFFPRETGQHFEFPTLLQSLAPHREYLTLFTNLDHPDVGGGHGCSNTFLNGINVEKAKDQPQRLETLDQFLGEKIGQTTRFPTVLLGGSGVSWSPAGVKLPTEADPARVFMKLFLSDSPKLRQQTRQYLEEDASILDVVYEDAKGLGGKLAKADRGKLDQFLTAVREVERKLKRKSDWLDINKPKVSDAVIRGDDEGDDTIDLTYPYNTAVMYDLMVLALQTNSTNVISYGHPGGNRLFPFDGVTLGYHSLTHHGKRPDLLKELRIIERFYAEQFSRFLSKLRDIQDRDGQSLLDSTVVLFGSGMGNASSHSSRNLPVMVAGGGFRGGSHHRFERQGRDGRPLSDLFVTILQQLGIQQDAFATSSSNLNHLLT